MADSEASDVEQLAELLGEPVSLTPLGGGDICRSFRVHTTSGRWFAKTPRVRDPQMFASEVWGLQQIRDTVPELAPGVHAYSPQWLVLDWVDEIEPSPRRAEAVGRSLARLHSRHGQWFGEGPVPGRIGSLEMPSGTFESWPAMYAELRLAPLAPASSTILWRMIERLHTHPGDYPHEPPSLIHGDLWSGNVVWSEPAMLIDPAAHYGSRETDLAMLQLFGCPYLEHVLRGYEQVYPLLPGWRERVGLMQLWPLLVHAKLFGGGYLQRAEQVASQYL